MEKASNVQKRSHRPNAIRKSMETGKQLKLALKYIQSALLKRIVNHSSDLGLLFVLERQASPQSKGVKRGFYRFSRYCVRLIPEQGRNSEFFNAPI